MQLKLQTFNSACFHTFKNKPTDEPEIVKLKIKVDSVFFLYSQQLSYKGILDLLLFSEQIYLRRPGMLQSDFEVCRKI